MTKTEDKKLKKRRGNQMYYMHGSIRERGEKQETASQKEGSRMWLHPSNANNTRARLGLELGVEKAVTGIQEPGCQHCLPVSAPWETQSQEAHCSALVREAELTAALHDLSGACLCFFLYFRFT